MRERLYSTAKDVGEPGFDADSGWGIVRMQPGAAEDTLAKSGSLHGLVSPDPTASANERGCRRMKKFCSSLFLYDKFGVAVFIASGIALPQGVRHCGASYIDP